MKTLDEILRATCVGDIFEKDNIKNQYYQYLKKYHPDLHNGDEKYQEATQKIIKLYNKAIELTKNKTWEEKDVLFIKMPNNKKIVAKYSYEEKFELGNMYVCKTKVIYLIDKKYKKFYENVKVNEFFYNLNQELKKNFDIFIPKIKYKFESNEYYVIIFEKTKDMIPLKCLINNFNGTIPHTHTAWIMSRLSNLCCLFKMAQIVQCGIDIENIFVSPDFHTVMLYGGWWYSVKTDSKLIGTTQNIFNCMPIYSKSKKIAREDIDLQSVKMVGKILTKNCQDLPTPFKNWLNGGSGTNSVIEFGKWDSALNKSYGKRKFIKCYFDYEKFYKKTT